jgi:YidC/Oxa1 family membrane protein insertase
MDKNTIYGLILMVAVFFAFMMFSPREPQSTDGDTATEQVAAVPEGADILSPTECEWLRENIREHGDRALQGDDSYVYSLNQGGVNLTLTGDSVTGSVTTPSGSTLKWSDIMAGDLSKMSVSEQRAAVKMVRNISTNMGRYGKFSRFLAGRDSVVNLENDVLKLQFNAKSGAVTHAELKKYTTEYHADETVNTKRQVVLFDGDSNALDFEIPLPQAVSTADLYFTPRVVNDSTVEMTLNVAEDVYWGIRYTLPKGDSYVLKMDVIQKNMAHAVQSNNRNLRVNWHQNMARQEKGRTFEERQSALYYKYAGGDVEHLSENSDDSEDKIAKVRWIGFKNQFFSSVLVSNRPFNTADFKSEVLKNSDYLKSMTANAVVNDYDWNSANPASFSMFLGPNLYPLLSDLDDQINIGEDLHLTKVIPLGWSIFRWINTLIVIPIFTFLGSFISNYGIIILLLTIFIKLVLFPLTYKSLISQAKMRILAPDIKEINDKYPAKEDAMLRQQKTMALYSKAGASPFSGCLPMLLQLPILFAMFSFFPSCIELRGQSFLWASNLAAPDAIISWSAHIPFVTEYFGNHISLFCLLMTAVNIIYTHINMQNNSANSSMPGMKWMMYLMPVFFLVFFNNYASGLSYYYFLSLLITIVQTYAFRHFVKEEDVRAAMKENAKKPKKKSGFMARMEEIQRQQQQMLREQQKQQHRK